MHTPSDPDIPTLRKERRVCIGINIKLKNISIKDYLLGVDYERLFLFFLNSAVSKLFNIELLQVNTEKNPHTSFKRYGSILILENIEKFRDH